MKTIWCKTCKVWRYSVYKRKGRIFTLRTCIIGYYMYKWCHYWNRLCRERAKRFLIKNAILWFSPVMGLNQVTSPIFYGTFRSWGLVFFAYYVSLIHSIHNEQRNDDDFYQVKNLKKLIYNTIDIVLCMVYRVEMNMYT